jgi:NADH-quinone oxidoreductase subunit L
MFELHSLIVLIPALPLAAAILTAVLGPRVLGRNAHWPAVLGIGGAFLCSVVLAAAVQMAAVTGDGVQEVATQVGYERLVRLWQWVDVQQAFSAAVPVAQSVPEAVRESGEGGWDFDVAVTLRVDALTCIMLVMVTLVSTLVAVYSIGYMRDDRGYWRFFAYVALFVFSMTMLVSVSNFALLYVFWEAVGVCSYLLIGFWYQKPAAAAAGKKAFLVNRVGDFGFALAIFLIWTTYRTLNFHDTGSVAGVLGQQRLLGELGWVGGGVGLAICLLLLVGACGKSAQFPLHVWLPDAMEGPTPVSALIHAATMVTAGVYMIARCMPLFMASPEAQLMVSVIGGLTAILAALVALTQFDLKRILAYSTISQLGYMFLGLGTGTLAGVTAGMFHLFTHAFFKALLFLGAGSVMHAMGNVIDIRRFGGLRGKLPITYWTFAVGSLALAGILPLGGFWSKDAILASVHDKIHVLQPAADGHNVVADHGAELASAPVYLTTSQISGGYQAVYYVAMFAALLTAVYTFRAFFMTFHGPEKIPEEAGDHAHESPPTMWVTLVILAVLAAVVGVLFEPTHWFAKLLEHTPVLGYEAVLLTPQPGKFHVDIAFQSTVIALIGTGLAAYLYLGSRREVEWLKYAFSFAWFEHVLRRTGAARLGGSPALAAVQRGADRIGLGWLTQLIGRAILLLVLLLISPLYLLYWVSPYALSRDKFFLDEIYVVLFVWPLRAVAWASDAIDRWLIDGLVNLCGRIPVTVGGWLRRMQVGLVSFYGLAMVLGIMLVLFAVQALWNGG